MIDVSIVSHGHGKMVDALIGQLLPFACISKIILTQNISEKTKYIDHPRVHILKNASPKGFGCNHNRASKEVDSPYLCILNPDVKFLGDPFPILLRRKEETHSNLIAPMVVNANQEIEDSVRRFPGIYSLFKKLIGLSECGYKFNELSEPFAPDWIAGMFMLFDVDSFQRVGGFDERFFLYYEDVDLCARLWKSDMKIVCDPSVSIIHNAQRSSRREYRYMAWHAASMARYFVKHWGRLPSVSAF